MEKLRRGVCNIPDFLDCNGLWSKGYSETTPTEYIYYHTRGGKLWNGVKNRSNKGGSCQKNMPSYEGTNYLFSSFQSFVEWCHTQQGYFELEEFGKFWQLDKDILVSGNQSYVYDRCCFVPTYINSLLVNCSKPETGLPLGVGWHTKANKYISKIQVESGETKHLGLFTSVEAAASKWLLEKATLIDNSSQRYILHKSARLDVYEALTARSTFMRECAVNHQPLYSL